MAKIILILSILAMGGATFFGIKNRQTLIDLKKQTIAINKQIDGDYIAYSEAAEAAEKVKKTIATEKEGQDVVVAAIGARKREIAEIESAISSADEEIASIEARTAALQRELDSIGVSPDTLLEEKEAIEKAIVLANEEAETLKGEIDLTRNVVAGNRQAISAINARLQKRKEAIGARQLTVRVQDVNDEFGFIVLNAGKSDGVTASSQFLILRGSTLIAKVAASNVQSGSTVANVVPGSLVAGAVIMPGDTAILDAR